MQFPDRGLGQALARIDEPSRQCEQPTADRAALGVMAEELQRSLVSTSVFDHPDRSQIGRVITHCHHYRLPVQRLPEVQGADDAAAASWLPIESLALSVLASKVLPGALAYLRAWSRMPQFKDLAGQHVAIEEYRRKWQGAPYAPFFTTVDAVVEALGHVLLVRRGAMTTSTFWTRSSPSQGMQTLALWTEQSVWHHGEILKASVQRLRSKTEYTSLPAFLLPREFTLTQLQQVYEIVLGRALEKSAFRERVEAANLVVETGKHSPGGRGIGRPAKLYRLRSQEPFSFSQTFRPAVASG